jgi:hypothetical protein
MPRIILHAGQRGDFSPRSGVSADRRHLEKRISGSLPRSRYGETDRGHRAPQPHRATRHHRQRRKPVLRLEQREVIGRIHLHHLGGDDSTHVEDCIPSLV